MLCSALLLGPKLPGGPCRGQRVLLVFFPKTARRPPGARCFLRCPNGLLKQRSVLIPSSSRIFVLADLGPDESSPLLLAPLSRNEGLILIRRLLLRCYSGTPAEKRPDLSLIGVHSLKVTFLSFSKQLLIEEPLRLLQGHHRGSLRSMSELYGRDDVAAPLQVRRRLSRPSWRASDR